MGIDDLSLSPELLADLYPESLVYTAPAAVQAVPQKKAAASVSVYPFLGKNLRSISVLVDYPNDPFIPTPVLQLLEKMLKACHCSLEDIAVLNIYKHPVEWNELKKQLNPSIVFLWGPAPADLGLSSALPLLVNSTVGGLSVIPIANPDEMLGSSPDGLKMKQQLWALLKKIFQL